MAEHKAATRRQIIAAGCQLFASQGYERTRLTEIASLTGVGRTTFYEYFPSKRELLHAVVESEVRPALEAALPGLTEQDALERLCQLFDLSYEMVANRPIVGILLFTVVGDLPREERDRIWQAAAPFSDEIRRICRIAVDAGEIVPSCGEGLAQAVIDLLVGGIVEALRSDDVAAAAAAVRDRRVRILRLGIAPWLHPVDESVRVPQPS